MFVPVVDADGKPLMPCHPARARELVHKGKACRRFNKGLFYIKLLSRHGGQTQPVVAGIDPGLKKEGFSVKSSKHTFVNVQTDAVTWVKRSLHMRKALRRLRRLRNTPCRSPRRNHVKGTKINPSIKARWQWKLRVAVWLSKLYPVTAFVVEDVKAKSKKGSRKWNRAFSTIEHGKAWFYSELSKLAPTTLKNGWDTKQLRDSLRLKKTSRKLAEVFEAHCVDAWVLANDLVGGHSAPDNTKMLCLVPLRLHRRQLHVANPSKGGTRKPYGGTKSLGFKRGSIVKHKKWGVVYIGGCTKSRVTLTSLEDASRVSRDARPEDTTFLAYSSWRFYLR